MRSVHAPRVAHDATVEIGAGGRARAVNLSTGGIYLSADQQLDPGAHVHLKVNLRDGSSPLDVDGEVVWRADGGMALRFVGLDHGGRGRIQRLVQRREAMQFSPRDVRLHLPALNTPLRAAARDLTERGVMIEAELPWLQLGSAVTTELSPDRACDGRVQWIGLDVTPAGSARLRIFIDLAPSASDGPLAPFDLPPPQPFPGASGAIDVAPRRRWIWPTIAVAAMLSTAAMAGALLRHPPEPTLLPTAPPERDPRVMRIPPQLAVPLAEPAGTTPTAPAVTTTATAAGTTTAAMPARATAAATPAATTPAATTPAAATPAGTTAAGTTAAAAPGPSLPSVTPPARAAAPAPSSHRRPTMTPSSAGASAAPSSPSSPSSPSPSATSATPETPSAPTPHSHAKTAHKKRSHLTRRAG